MIDTHCHLTDGRLSADIDGVLARAREAEVKKIIVPATNLADAKKVIELTEKYEEVYGLVGVHPEEVMGLGLYETENIKAILRELIEKSKKIVGIGEIGLDFYHDRDRVTKKEQLDLWRAQMELAMEMNLPVVVHQREAESEMEEVLMNLKKVPRGQFHCWSGGEDLLREVLIKDFYVSFCGNVTYKSAGELRELIKIVPLERLLLETDAPYLPPEPKRGGVNEPANVKITAQFLADWLPIPFQDLVRMTSLNAKCLFSGI